MLTEARAQADNAVQAWAPMDWRRQAAHEFGEDALAPMMKQFLGLLQSIYAASCQGDQTRSMSVQFLAQEDDHFTTRLTELFAAFAAEQLNAPVCLMSFDRSNRVNIVNFGSFIERHPLRGRPTATMSDTRELDLVAASSEAGTDGLPDSVDHRQDMELAVADEDPAERLSSHIDRERSKAALLIVNSRPLDDSFESLMISRKVDGVIMVIDAERTVAEAAMATCNSVRAVGGHILGAALKSSMKEEPAASRSSPMEPGHYLSDAKGLVGRMGRAVIGTASAMVPSFQATDGRRSSMVAFGLCMILACFALVALLTYAPAVTASKPAFMAGRAITDAIPHRTAASPTESANGAERDGAR